MTILDHLISTLDLEAEIRDIRQGVFHTGVLTRHCGLAATLPKDALRQDPPLVRNPGFLQDLGPADLVGLVHSDSILEAAMGMAAINSLIEVDTEQCVELNAAEIIMDKGAGNKVAVVGHFPFLGKVRDRAETLWVIEKNPKDGDASADQADELIPRADVVAITGTSLTNHTLEHLLDLCRPEAYVVMLGDSVPLSPVMFDYHVDALSGTLVVDEQTALRCVSQGANFRQIKGVKRLTMFKP